MKRSTAIKNVKEIVRRVNSVNGIIGTPKHEMDFYRIKRVWLFGSVAKGSNEPNDIDIIIEGIGVETGGNRRHTRERFYPGYSGRYERRGGKHTDRIFEKRESSGYFQCKSSKDYAIKWLRSGMKSVSIHTVRGEGRDFLEQLDKKVLIYPRCDFDFI